MREKRLEIKKGEVKEEIEKRRKICFLKSEKMLVIWNIFVFLVFFYIVRVNRLFFEGICRFLGDFYFIRGWIFVVSGRL